MFDMDGSRQLLTLPVEVWIDSLWPMSQKQTSTTRKLTCETQPVTDSSSGARQWSSRIPPVPERPPGASSTFQSR
jgi:hypothetical protein